MSVPEKSFRWTSAFRQTARGTGEDGGTAQASMTIRELVLVARVFFAKV